ncbi:MAG: MarR family transcriptional regulator [Oscillospiraceae bacterium]|nr:MarR family transcriptional regulator [Oscillospiraceae bacterium]
MDRKQLIGPKVKTLSNAMDQEMNRSTAELDLTGSQAFVLGYLVHHTAAPVYPRDIEREFVFSHPTVSGILQRLESKGFVVFQAGKADRRCKQIITTELARQRHEAMVRRMYEVDAKCTAGMAEAEVAELHRLLGVAMVNMGAALSCHKKPGREEQV